MFFEAVKQGANDWWRYIIGLSVVIMGYMIGQIPLVLALIRSIDEHADLQGKTLNDFFADPDFEVFHIHSNMGYMLLLSMFFFSILAFFGVFKLLHKRAFKTVISGLRGINWKKIIFGFVFWLILGLCFEAIFYFQNPDLYTFRFKWQVFVPLLLISLLILPLQTTLEEVVFRGYLMQWFGLIAKNKWLPLIITSILFGLMHSMNPEIEKFGMLTMQIYYVGAGLLLGVITIMDDGLELAIGIHAATNFIGAVFLGYEGAALQTESLFKVSEINPLTVTIGMLICGAIFIAVASRCYKWESFRSIFNEIKYELPADQIDNDIVV